MPAPRRVPFLPTRYLAFYSDWRIQGVNEDEEDKASFILCESMVEDSMVQTAKELLQAALGRRQDDC